MEKLKSLMDTTKQQFLISAFRNEFIWSDEMRQANQKLIGASDKMLKTITHVPQNDGEIQKFKRQTFRKFFGALQTGYINKDGDGEALNSGAASLADEQLWFEYMHTLRNIKTAEVALCSHTDESLGIEFTFPVAIEDMAKFNGSKVDLNRAKEMAICIDFISAMDISIPDFVRGSLFMGDYIKHDVKNRFNEETNGNWDNFLYCMDNIQIYNGSDKNERRAYFPDGLRPSFDMMYSYLGQINKQKLANLSYDTSTTQVTTSTLSL